MAKVLYKLGFWAANHAKMVVFSAIGVLLAMGIIVATLWFDFDDDMSIPGTPAQKTVEMLEKDFPEVGKAGAQIQIVFKAPDDKTLQDAAIQKDIAKLVKKLKS